MQLRLSHFLNIHADDADARGTQRTHGGDLASVAKHVGARAQRIRDQTRRSQHEVCHGSRTLQEGEGQGHTKSAYWFCTVHKFSVNVDIIF